MRLKKKRKKKVQIQGKIIGRDGGFDSSARCLFSCNVFLFAGSELGGCRAQSWPPLVPETVNSENKTKPNKTPMPSVI